VSKVESFLDFPFSAQPISVRTVAHRISQGSLIIILFIHW